MSPVLVSVAFARIVEKIHSQSDFKNPSNQITEICGENFNQSRMRGLGARTTESLTKQYLVLCSVHGRCQERSRRWEVREHCSSQDKDKLISQAAMVSVCYMQARRLMYRYDTVPGMNLALERLEVQ